MTRQGPTQQVARVAFPAISRNGGDILVQVRCIAFMNKYDSPVAPDRRFEEVIKRYRGIEGAANPPYTFFDTTPPIGDGLELVGNSFQLAVVVADKMARHGTAEVRPVIATGCLPQNDGLVEAVDAVDFEKKLDLLINLGPSGAVFIFPAANAIQAVGTKLQELKAKRATELRPITRLDDLKGSLWREVQSRTDTRSPVPRLVRVATIVSVVIVGAIYVVVPYIYRNVGLDAATLADENDWATARELNSVDGFQTYRRTHPAGQHAVDAQKIILAAQTDEHDWEAAKASDTIAAYERYLSNHPHGGHVAEGQLALVALRSDESDFATAVKQNTATAYENYVNLHPSGRHGAYARQTAASLRRDDDDWAASQKSNSIEAYEAYIKSHPRSDHAPQALAAIKAIRIESSDWARPMGLNTKSSYQEYLNSHPRGIHALDAQRAIAEIQSEEADWSIADRANRIAGYEKYLAQHPKGPHADTARVRLASPLGPAMAACTVGQSSGSTEDMVRLTFEVIEDGRLVRSIVSGSTTSNQSTRLREGIANGDIQRFPGDERLTVNLLGLNSDTFPKMVPYLLGANTCAGMAAVARTSDGTLRVSVPVRGGESRGIASVLVPRDVLLNSNSAQFCVEASFPIYRRGMIPPIFRDEQNIRCGFAGEKPGSTYFDDAIRRGDRSVLAILVHRTETTERNPWPANPESSTKHKKQRPPRFFPRDSGNSTISDHKWSAGPKQPTYSGEDSSFSAGWKEVAPGREDPLGKGKPSALKRWSPEGPGGSEKNDFQTYDQYFRPTEQKQKRHPPRWLPPHYIDSTTPYDKRPANPKKPNDSRSGNVLPPGWRIAKPPSNAQSSATRKARDGEHDPPAQDYSTPSERDYSTPIERGAKAVDATKSKCQTAPDGSSSCCLPGYDPTIVRNDGFDPYKNGFDPYENRPARWQTECASNSE